MKARTPIRLPEEIKAYWDAANSGRAEAAGACFASDAVVLDEGQTHSGLPAIRSWIDETTQKYRPVVEPLRLQEAEGKHLVTARVSGSFPGSPAELNFAFTLQGGKISRLEIQ